MANLQVKDATASSVYMKTSGSGTDMDPYIPEHLESNSGDIKTSLASIDSKITACDTGAVVLAAGTAAIGKLAANDGVDIGDVTINNAAGSGVYIRPGTSAAFPVTDNDSTLSIDDGGDSITVDGTFWQETQPISAASLPLPTGAATSAKQDTGNTSLSSLDGKIATCDTDDVTISSSALPDGAATESTLSSVDGKITACNTGAVVLAAGTAAFGKLAANSGVDIGDVTINNTAGSGVYIQPATGVNLDTSDVTIGAALPAGTNLLGKMKLSDGTNEATVRSLTNSKALNVAIVDENGDQITSFAGGGGGDGTQYTEGATDSTITGTAILWEDTSDTLRTVSASKPLPVNLISGAALPITDNSDSITVDNDGTFAVQAAQDGTWNVGLSAGSNAIGKLAANSGVDIGDVDVTSVIPGTGATNLGKAEDTAHTSGDVGVMALAVRNDAGTALAGTTGDYIPLTTDSTGALRVTSTGGGGGGTEYTEGDTDASITGTAILWEGTSDTLKTVSASNPLPVDVTSGITSATEYTEGDTDSSITGTAILWEDSSDTLRSVSASKPLPVNLVSPSAVSMVGNVAHDAADSGNPTKIGGKARQTNPTAVSDGDRVDASFDDLGRQIVLLNQPRDLVDSQVTTITSSTSETTIVTAGGSGVLNDLTSLAVTNKSATGTIVTLKDSTGGTTRGIYYVGPGGGIVLTFPSPKKQSSANNNWTLTCGTSVDSVYVVAEFVKNV